FKIAFSLILPIIIQLTSAALHKELPVKGFNSILLILENNGKYFKGIEKPSLITSLFNSFVPLYIIAPIFTFFCNNTKEHKLFKYIINANRALRLVSYKILTILPFKFMRLKKSIKRYIFLLPPPCPLIQTRPKKFSPPLFFKPLY